MHEERHTVQTPERVALELELAGLGSRFAAALVDGLIQSALLALLLGGLAALGALSCEPVLASLERQTRGEPDALAPLLSGRFFGLCGGGALLIQWLYHGLFEGWRSGQTPGKRLLGLRVVQVGGHPVRRGAALLRNLLRPLDFLPIFFGLGAALALLSPRSQRLGDLCARTLVVRERAGAGAALEPPPDERPAAPSVHELSAEESALVACFLDRREALDPSARDRLAVRLAGGLRRRHGDLGAGPLGAEAYLERLGRP